MFTEVSVQYKRMARENYKEIIAEIVIRVLLGVLFICLEFMEPFHRELQPEEMWLYKNPRSNSYVPASALWVIISVAPLLVILVFYFIRKDKIDAIQSFLGLTLTMALNGVLTNTIKLIVGRPRPDFFWRCFPDGQYNPSMVCSGDKDVITEGLKSFPSGHSSFSFASLGFISFYMLGKLQTFTARGRGESWRLVVSITPLLVALIIALSRTCDYHHHWQDVLVGSLLGLCLSWLCYRQYYPALTIPTCAIPYTLLHDPINEELKKDQNLQDVAVKWI